MRVPPWGTRFSCAGEYNSYKVLWKLILRKSGEAVSVLYTHARKIVQQTSSGGEYDAWGAAVDVVASTQVGDGPSAPSVAQVHSPHSINL